MQLTLQAANNRNMEAILKPPAPYQVMHLEPATLHGVATTAYLKAVFPNSEDRIKVTFDADVVKLDFANRRFVTWNGRSVMPTVTVPRNSGKFTLGIRGLTLLVSLQ